MEFAVVWLFVRVLGLSPRSIARAVGAGVGALAFRALGRLREVGRRNLQLAYPDMAEAERERILRTEYRNLGWLMAEFAQMSGYTRESAGRFIRYEGLENFIAARERGKGVLVLTGHLGAWELSSFFHSLMGMPMGMVIRRLDNPLVDRFVNSIRCRHGNRVMHKDDFARGLIGAMRAGQTVGILMDTNMTPPQGVFVDFFGIAACTAVGIARMALHTDAAVVPAFTIWDPVLRRYRVEFTKAIELIRTGDGEADALTNTAAFNRIFEEYVRKYPDQWLWVHRRWKTRPPGEPPLY